MTDPMESLAQRVAEGVGSGSSPAKPMSEQGTARAAVPASRYHPPRVTHRGPALTMVE